LVLHFEYNGTSDVCLTALYRTHEEMHEHWRSWAEKKCTCGKDEPVRIYTDYAMGFSYNGRACRYCMAITDGIECNEDSDDYESYEEDVDD
jgi:hypothetical protein